MLKMSLYYFSCFIIVELTKNEYDIKKQNKYYSRSILVLEKLIFRLSFESLDNNHFI